MRYVFLVTALILTTNLFAQYTLVETKQKSGANPNSITDQVYLSYSKYSFSNKLTLIISEDHSDPVVSVNVTYKIGSANDYSDRTGMAYFTYKLMNEFANNGFLTQYNKILGTYDATQKTRITKDFTSFSVSAPKNLLPYLLYGEATRIKDLIPGITDAVYDSAKNSILEEIYEKNNKTLFADQNYLADKALLPFSHPYSWPVYGLVQHYESFNRNDLLKFISNWYGSNNIILTVSGDVDPEVVLKLVNSYFGNLKEAENSSLSLDNTVNLLRLPSESSLSQNRYITSELEIDHPVLIIKFAGVPKYSSEDNCLTFLSRFLTSGNNSFLYKRLVKTGVATSVKSYFEADRLDGTFVIQIDAKPLSSLAVVKDSLFTALNDFFSPKKPVDDEEQFRKPRIPGEKRKRPLFELLNTYMNAEKLEMLKDLELSSTKAELLSGFEYYKENPNYSATDLAQLATITPMMMIEAGRRILVSSYAVYMSIVPTNQKQLAAGIPNYLIPDIQTIITHTKKEELDTIIHNYTGLKPAKIKKLPVAVVPQYHITEQENGLKMYEIASGEVNENIVILKINIPDEILKTNCQAAFILQTILEGRYEGINDGDLKNLIEVSGGSCRFSHTGNEVQIRTTFSGSSFMAIREVFQTLLLNPVPVPDDINFEEILLELKNSSDIVTLMNGVFRGFAGIDNRNDLEKQGFDISIKRSFAEIQQNFNALSSPKNASLIILYNPNDAMMFSEIKEIFRIWQNNNMENKADLHAMVPQGGNGKIFILDQPASKMPHAFVNFMNIEFDAYNKFPQAKMMSGVLGSFEGNLLETNIEKVNSSVVNASASFEVNKSVGYFTINLMTKPDSLGAGISSVMRQMEKLKTYAPDKKTFAGIKKNYLASEIMDNESSWSKTDLCALLAANNLGKDYFVQEGKAIKKMKPAAIQSLATQYLSSSKMNIFVFGNKEQLLPQLQKLGFGEIVEIDQFGKVLNIYK